MNPAKSLPPYRVSSAEVVAAFDSDTKRGLPAAAIPERLQRYGRNELPAAPPVPAWRRFLAQLSDPLTILLLVATVVSFVAWWIERDAAIPYEALTIVAIVILNAVLGFVQESRAEHAIAALAAMSAPNARVLRDGEQRSVPTAVIVPGDILVLEEGDTVAADARVLESIAMRAAESALTGESAPVSKDSRALGGDAGIADRSNMVFSGTAISSGRGRAIVTASGIGHGDRQDRSIPGGGGRHPHPAAERARSDREAARHRGDRDRGGRSARPSSSSSIRES